MTSESTNNLSNEALRLMRAGRLTEALVPAEQAVIGTRICLPAHGLLATILLQLGRPKDAEAAVLRALECKPGPASAYDGLAHVSMLLGLHELSNTLYRRVVTIAPDNAPYWYNLASSERSFGRLMEAETACDQSISLDATHYQSYLLRSELRVQTAAANHIEELQRQLINSGGDNRARVFLGYALGKELDDLQCYSEAFGSFSDAAATRRRQLAYDVADDERKLRRIIQVFSRAWTTPTGSTLDSSRYVFIVGLPRTGTTLLERILTNLPGIRSNGETDNFSRALMGASRGDQGDVFERAAAASADTVITQYAALADRGEPNGMIVEKLPMNYLYLGAIHRFLPEAKVLLVTRSPLDSCFAMYRTLFGHAYPFSYDFDDLARYYVAYDRLVSHWRETLGMKLYEVVYEHLVKDPMRVGSAVARHCGLQWSDEASAIHKNASVSMTASAAQIRGPIYGSSTGRWRRYRPHLDPLVRSLRDGGITLPDDA